MDFLLRRRLDLQRGHDQFQFLRDHAFDLQELRLVLEFEFLRSRHIDVMRELFPAFEMALHLNDQRIDFFIAAHGLLADEPVTGARNTIAPPRNSRAVTFNAAKFTVNSVRTTSAACALRKVSTITRPISNTSFSGTLLDSVDVTIRPVRSIVNVPEGSRAGVDTASRLKMDFRKAIAPKSFSCHPAPATRPWNVPSPRPARSLYES